MPWLFGVTAEGNAYFFPCESQTLSTVKPAMTELNIIVKEVFSEPKLRLQLESTLWL